MNTKEPRPPQKTNMKSWSHQSEHPPQDLLVDAGSTKDLVVTAQRSQLSNGGVEHGPLWLNVSSLPCNAIKALLEGRIQDLVE